MFPVTMPIHEQSKCFPNCTCRCSPLCSFQLGHHIGLESAHQEWLGAVGESFPFSPSSTWIFRKHMYLPTCEYQVYQVMYLGTQQEEVGESRNNLQGMCPLCKTPRV
jgi:hypothetical protein